ncbi:hypothetical protein E2562_024550 [Oryza meyeriana var. granulata]|uniref:C2H2-type domain-containing protein n=1 Tax=Oryza meyeriana var. granulata TaxID=110450 RepID=A0A6G1BMB6_9ORYZ|nr:hypothetical protein E2562_024550 [Oryza meyeriana var. granulata]
MGRKLHPETDEDVLYHRKYGIALLHCPDGVHSKATIRCKECIARFKTARDAGKHNHFTHSLPSGLMTKVTSLCRTLAASTISLPVAFFTAQSNVGVS